MAITMAASSISILQWPPKCRHLFYLEAFVWFSVGYSPSSTMDIKQLTENTHMKYRDYMNVHFKDIFLFISNI